jgi:hypothetical protein
MIDAIDRDWDTRIISIDGEVGYKCFQRPVGGKKRTLRKNRAWEFCYAIVKWQDPQNKDDNGYDYFCMKYDDFCLEEWQEWVNFADCIFDEEWEVVCDGVCDDIKEFNKLWREHIQTTLL